MLPASGPLTTKSLIVGQAWSTVYELYFYCLFAILLCTGRPRKYIIPLIVVFCIAGFGYRFVGLPITGALGFFSSIMGSTHVLFFIEGVIIALLFERGIFKSWNKKIFFATFVALMLIYLWRMTNTYNQLLSFVLSPCVFIGVLQLNHYLRADSVLNKILVFCGDISFSIYLVHILIIRVIINELNICNVYAVGTLSIILTMLISGAIYMLIERPGIALGKRLIRQRNSNH